MLLAVTLAAAPAIRGPVTYVVDGDTVHVGLGGRDERVRLIGIDTPEVGQCDAAKATAIARRLAFGRTATLVADPTQARRDRYGRLLAYVVLPGGVDLGYEELLHGYARVYIYDRPFQRLAVYGGPSGLAARAPTASGAVADDVRSGRDHWPMRCAECRRESLDARWSPLCPVCYELLRQEQRREQTRPPEFDAAAWTDAAALDSGFEAALGPKLP